MVAADRNSKPQTEKVLKLVAGVTEKIRQGRCSGELANYLMTACVGGILNYHAPFTRLSETQIETWDKHIRAVLRQKTGVQQSTSLGLLYDRSGVGLGWFSVRGCINEAVITEGWIAATSDTLEGRLLRDQVGRRNKQKGTIFSPWRSASGLGKERSSRHTSRQCSLRHKNMASIGSANYGTARRGDGRKWRRGKGGRWSVG